MPNFPENFRTIGCAVEKILNFESEKSVFFIVFGAVSSNPFSLGYLLPIRLFFKTQKMSYLKK